MSLTSWLTDYVFLPLNIKFRKLGVNGTIIAIMLNMAFIGMWHGANWTFLLFGIYHGLWYIPLMVSGQFFKKRKILVNVKGWPTQPYVMKMIGIYFVVTFGLMLFHSSSMTEFFQIWGSIFSHWNGGLFFDMNTMVNAAICSIALIYVDIQCRCIVRNRNSLFHRPPSSNKQCMMYTSYIYYSSYALIIQ